MIRHLRTFGLLASIVLVLLLPTSVFASGPAPWPSGGYGTGGMPGPWPFGGSGPGRDGIPDPEFGEGKYSESDIETAAKFLEMEEDELEAQLWAGKTLADIAEAKGASIVALRDAVQAARYRELTDEKDKKDEKDGKDGEDGKGGPAKFMPQGWGSMPQGWMPVVGVPMRTTGQYGLNLRCGPGTSYSVCANVPHGTIVYFIGETQLCGSSRWSKIVFDGRVLWAVSSYLSPA